MAIKKILWLVIEAIFVRTNTAALAIIVVSLPFTVYLFGTPLQFATLIFLGVGVCYLVASVYIVTEILSIGTNDLGFEVTAEYFTCINFGSL